VTQNGKIASVVHECHPRCLVRHKAEEPHKIELIKSPVTTLVITGKRRRKWGYLTHEGWIESNEYRKRKNEGDLPE
jgi:hypothetical protein